MMTKIMLVFIIGLMVAGCAVKIVSIVGDSSEGKTRTEIKGK